MYKLSQVAEAVGVNARTLSDWLDRKIIDLPATGRGNHRDFSIRETDKIAIIAGLTRLGLPVADAAKAARAFCDERSKGRPRAQLHTDGATTALLITQGVASVHRVYDKAEFDSVMSQLFADEFGVVVLNISAVLKRVDDALAKGASTPKPPAGAIYRYGRPLFS